MLSLCPVSGDKLRDYCDCTEEFLDLSPFALKGKRRKFNYKF